MGLLKTIAILIIIYYFFKFLSKYIVPIFLRKMVRNVEKKMKNQQNYQNETKGEIGETIIDKKPPNAKQSNKNTGEYIDYEDVDE